MLSLWIRAVDLPDCCITEVICEEPRTGRTGPNKLVSAVYILLAYYWSPPRQGSAPMEHLPESRLPSIGVFLTSSFTGVGPTCQKTPGLPRQTV